MSDNGLLLDLSTVVDRPQVRITSQAHPDGRLYELVLPDELGIEHHQRIQHYAGKASKLQNKSPERLTQSEAQMLTAALDDVLAMVCPALDVADELSDQQKATVVQTWIDINPETDGGDSEGPTTGDS